MQSVARREPSPPKQPPCLVGFGLAADPQDLTPQAIEHPKHQPLAVDAREREGSYQRASNFRREGILEFAPAPETGGS